MIRRLLFLLCGLFLLLVGCDGYKGSPTAPEDEIAPGQIYVDIHVPERACNGTTLLSDGHDQDRPRVVEVDMQGKILWEYVIPEQLRRGEFVGLDAELLSNGNILLSLSRSGLYEINRDGDIVWSHRDPKVSHDADRLANGNTIYVFGSNDQKGDAQVKEVSRQGQIVWSWHAKDHYDVEPYSSISS